MINLLSHKELFCKSLDFGIFKNPNQKNVENNHIIIAQVILPILAIIISEIKGFV
jgi:hypothetical protein